MHVVDLMRNLHHEMSRVRRVTSGRVSSFVARGKGEQEPALYCHIGHPARHEIADSTVTRYGSAGEDVFSFK